MERKEAPKCEFILFHGGINCDHEKTREFTAIKQVFLRYIILFPNHTHYQTNNTKEKKIPKDPDRMSSVH